MESRGHIYLIGLPGSGKTTLGRQLAQQANLSFVDLDAAIERDQQKTIASIFEKLGEEHFRNVEARMLREVAQQADPLVVATGGGAPCFGDNLAMMQATGTTVFLDVPALEIAKRMDQGHTHARPLLATIDQYSLKDHIEFLRSQRLPFYRQAHHTLKGSAITVGDVLMALRVRD